MKFKIETKMFGYTTGVWVVDIDDKELEGLNEEERKVYVQEYIKNNVMCDYDDNL